MNTSMMAKHVMIMTITMMMGCRHGNQLYGFGDGMAGDGVATESSPCPPEIVTIISNCKLYFQTVFSILYLPPINAIFNVTCTGKKKDRKSTIPISSL